MKITALEFSSSLLLLRIFPSDIIRLKVLNASLGLRKVVPMMTGMTAYFSIGPIRSWLTAQGPYRVTEALEISPMDVEDDGVRGFSPSY
jgi:hypothetical protein